MASNRNKGRDKKSLVEAIVWSEESHSVLFNPLMLTYNCSLLESLVWPEAPDVCYTTNNGGRAVL